MAKWTERFDVRTVADFAAVWLAVGFAAGTMTLLGPVRWITTAGVIQSHRQARAAAHAKPIGTTRRQPLARCPTR